VSDGSEKLPAAVVVKRGWTIWPWLIPIGAAVTLAVFAWQALAMRGPLVTIEFADGNGIAPGDPVSFRGVRVGDVTAVRLSEHLSKVAVEARLHRDAAGLAAEDSQWWIVRPEISAARVSGLDALLGPRYLEVSPGSGGVKYKFAGLDHSPGGGRDAQSAATGALELVLEASQRGSLAVDSPVLYRGMRVGSVRSMALGGTAQTVDVVVVIDAEYRALVRANSKFWSAGGIGVDFGLMRGLSVRAGSLESLVVGAVAFATPTKIGDEVESGHRFPLAAESKQEWMEWSPAVPQGKQGG
jgi:paraquat-inducible protein B